MVSRRKGPRIVQNTCGINAKAGKNAYSSWEVISFFKEIDISIPLKELVKTRAELSGLYYILLLFFIFR